MSDLSDIPYEELILNLDHVYPSPPPSASYPTPPPSYPTPPPSFTASPQATVVVTPPQPVSGAVRNLTPYFEREEPTTTSANLTGRLAAAGHQQQVASPTSLTGGGLPSLPQELAEFSSDILVTGLAGELVSQTQIFPELSSDLSDWMENTLPAFNPY